MHNPSRRRMLRIFAIGLTLPFAAVPITWILNPDRLEDLVGREVLSKITAALPAVDAFGDLLVLPGTRADLISFLLADEIEMPVRMPTPLDGEIVIALFTFSELPERLEVTMNFGQDPEQDQWRLMRKRFT